MIIRHIWIFFNTQRSVFDSPRSFHISLKDFLSLLQPPVTWLSTVMWQTVKNWASQKAEEVIVIGMRAPWRAKTQTFVYRKTFACVRVVTKYQSSGLLKFEVKILGFLGKTLPSNGNCEAMVTWPSPLFGLAHFYYQAYW